MRFSPSHIISTLRAPCSSSMPTGKTVCVEHALELLRAYKWRSTAIASCRPGTSWAALVRGGRPVCVEHALELLRGYKAECGHSLVPTTYVGGKIR